MAVPPTAARQDCTATFQDQHRHKVQVPFLPNIDFLALDYHRLTARSKDSSFR